MCRQIDHDLHLAVYGATRGQPVKGGRTVNVTVSPTTRYVGVLAENVPPTQPESFMVS